uniref:Ribosomal protein S12 n=1 Tax=Ichthyophthirius multifiliis TaxID=5932 RepID=G1FLB7_ICHMU|nr:ribosomal protein S12 [Ichthyophthirius multifiliis]AEL89259.1 ribosomal protein S12 [Ichthyophthirius multifiliis]
MLIPCKKKKKGNLNIKLRASMLLLNPQKKGTVVRVRILTPKKPNSAKRPVAKVMLVNKFRLTSHIPGIGHNLKKHSSVLIRGGGARDLPGVNYTCIRGVYDLAPVQDRRNRRSIYGIQNEQRVKKGKRKKIKNN